MSYLDGLQVALAGEHAAVFVVGYLGAQTSSSAQPVLVADLQTSYAVHRERRDALETLVRDAGGQPVAAAPSYDVDDVAQDPARISAGAAEIERACGATYGYLVANSADEQRRWAVDTLIDCAVRELTFGGEARTYPGR